MTDIKEQILTEASKIVNGARRSAYGTPENNFERIARFWQAYFLNTGRDVWLTSADVSPMMRLMKEARLCESPDHYDSHVDLIGYTLTGAEVNQVEEPSGKVHLRSYAAMSDGSTLMGAEADKVLDSYGARVTSSHIHPAPSTLKGGDVIVEDGKMRHPTMEEIQDRVGPPSPTNRVTLGGWSAEELAADRVEAEAASLREIYGPNRPPHQQDRPRENGLYASTEEWLATRDNRIGKPQKEN